MKLLSQIKERQGRLERWQRDSLRHVPTTASGETRHCHCCEHDYVGNYCPTCGQRAGTKRITWDTLKSGVMDVWGMGSRALPYTLWQLLLRPGNLIAGYINGRRQVSFPPVKMPVVGHAVAPAHGADMRRPHAVYVHLRLRVCGQHPHPQHRALDGLPVRTVAILSGSLCATDVGRLRHRQAHRRTPDPVISTKGATEAPFVVIRLKVYFRNYSVTNPEVA